MKRNEKDTNFALKNIETETSFTKTEINKGDVNFL